VPSGQMKEMRSRVTAEMFAGMEPPR